MEEREKFFPLYFLGETITTFFVDVVHSTPGFVVFGLVLVEVIVGGGGGVGKGGGMVMVIMVKVAVMRRMGGG